MRLVTDNGMDLDPTLLSGLDVHVVPIAVHLNNDALPHPLPDPHGFYRALRADGARAATTHPPCAMFVAVYRALAAERRGTDTSILSVHLSRALSETASAAREAANVVAAEGIAVTVIDTRTISGAQGWLVYALAQDAAAGASRTALLARARALMGQTGLVFSPETLRYLVAGGRVSHLTGLLADALDLRPVLSLDARGALHAHRGARGLAATLARQVALIAEQHPSGSALRVQLVHADAPDAAAQLRVLLNNTFDCHFLPDTSATPVVGAHAGPGMVGCVYAPAHLFHDALRPSAPR